MKNSRNLSILKDIKVLKILLLLSIFIFINILFYSTIFAEEEEYYILYETPFQIRGGYFYSYTLFDINNTISNKIYESIFPYFFVSFSFNLNYFLNYLSKTVNKGDIISDSGTLYLSSKFYYNKFFNEPYGLGIKLSYLNKILGISINLSFLTNDFKSYFNGINIDFKLDLYPYFFIDIKTYSSFFPIKLFHFYEENLNLKIFEKNDICFEAGIYLYQHEISFIYSKEKVRIYDNSSNYKYLSLNLYLVSLRFIPTYVNLGYTIKGGLTLSSYTLYENSLASTINNLFYYNIIFQGGLIYKLFNNFYIKGEIGYKTYYLSALNITFDENLKQLLFNIELIINL